MLLRVKRELYTLVFFGPKQQWKGVRRRPFRSVLFNGDNSNAQMFGNWWNCLNSFVRGCSSRERPSMLSRSWISSSDKSFSESWEVQLAGISNVVSNNEPTIMHVPAPITWCRPRGSYYGMERDLLTFAANFYPWMGSGSLKHFCSIFSKERPFVMHQAAKTKAFQDGGNPFRRRV